MNTWAVDPSTEWLKQNLEWTLEANLPGTERCPEKLMGYQCELRVDHTCSHVAKMNSRQPEQSID